MITAFDANFLLMLFDKKVKVPKRVGRPVIRDAQERIDLLVQDLAKKRSKIVLPTPALAEFLLLASDSYGKYIAEIKKYAVFEVFGFDDPSCIELVDLSLLHGKPKKFKPEDTWAKLKYDRQIVAIAKANRAVSIYTTDDGLGAFAEQCGLKRVDLEDLPELPPVQETLALHAGPKSAPAESPHQKTEPAIAPESSIDLSLELDVPKTISSDQPRDDHEIATKA